jgi:serine/threonine-protein kinase
MSLQVGARIGHYEIHSALGAGGMGEVYRARDTRLGRDVALKVLPDSFAADPERIGRFEREAQILAALSHPNIAAIHGLEISGPTRVLVMELVAGESLEARLRGGPLPLDEALAIARHIGEALSAAHERGVVHRDLKPGNIMLTGDGGVKVLDFGLARMVEPDAAVSGLTMSPTLSIQATVAGTILGTAPYMSPEQARGRTVDKRTDVWAFGCVLYEMLTGTRAFGGDDLTETIASIVKSEPDWSALDAIAPSPIVAIVRGCLVKDPKQRYADIAVPLHLLTQPAPAVSAASSPRPTTPVWRRTLPIAVTAIVATLVTTSVAWYTRPSPAPAPVTRFTIGLGGMSLTNTGRQAIALSPDGSRIVYTANQRLYSRSMADSEPRLIPGLENVRNYVASPAISPDGMEVAFWLADNRSLTRIAISGGTPVTICNADLIPAGLRWEGDGLLFGQNGKGIFKVPAAGGVPQLIAAVAADESVSSPQTLPGGRGLLYSVKKGTDSWDNGRIVVKTAGGEVKTLVEGAADGRYDGAGHLFYAVSGVVMAVRFDLDRLATTGAAIPVISGVLRFLDGANSGIAQYSLADNGTLAFVQGPTKVVEGANVGSLAIFDEKGNAEPLPVAPGFFAGLRVSPDALTVAYQSGTEPDFNIWLQDLAGKTASRRLTFAGRNIAPVWSPDNQWIAFRSNRDGDEAIFRQRADGTGTAERLTKPDPGTIHTPYAWSPDGSRLVYEIEKDQKFELHVLSLADRKSSRFSDVTSTVHMDPALSPDGRWLVYQRSDQPRVTDPSVSSPSTTVLQAFVEPFPSTGARYLVPVGPIAGHPQWTRTGDRLIINAASTSSLAVDFHATPSVAFGRPMPFPRLRRTEPNPLLNRRNSDALPGGRLLGTSIDIALEVSGEARRRDQIAIVLNWASELAARLPN